MMGNSYIALLLEKFVTLHKWSKWL